MPTTSESNFYEYFLVAEAYNRSGRLLHDAYGPNPIPDYQYVIAMNLAFSLELYLKSLLWHEKKKPRQNHKLEQQFANLFPVNQEAIKKAYANHIQTDPGKISEFERLRQVGADPDAIFDFDNALALSSEAFERSRYPFDPQYPDHGYLGWSIEVAVREVIVAISPSFDRAFDRLQKRHAIRSKPPGR